MGQLAALLFSGSLQSLHSYVQTMTEIAARLLDPILRMRNCQVCGYFYHFFSKDIALKVYGFNVFLTA